MSEIKLLPCPFCSGEAEFYRTPIKTNGCWCDSVVVRCKECEARTNRVLYNAEIHKNDSEYEEAAKYWNTRKPMQEIVERLEEVKEERMEVAQHTLDLVPDGQVWGLRKAIEICKEVGGMND